ncbi:hypothetical protein ES703_70073 [subsurface metagenome]
MLLGADAYSMRVFTGRKYGGIKQLMKAYEKALGKASTAKEATEFIIREYQDKKIGLDGDIVLVADRREAIAVEYSLNEWGLQFSGPNPYLIRTNFFLVLRHLRHLPQEKGLYLSAVKRYERAMEILSKTNINTTVDDLKEVCRDHYPEPSAMSICRHGGKGEYRTVGSVVIELVRNKIKIHYIAGMKPCQGGYQTTQMRLR